MPTQIPSSGIAAGAITADKIASGAVTAAKVAEGVGGGPKITGLDYPGDDTAALPAGGQTVIVNGAGFQSGCSVIIDGDVVSVVTFVTAAQISFQAPAKNTGQYILYVVNPDGGTAIFVPGIVYSGTPTWTTASGSLGTPYETASFSVNLAATGDGALTYAVTTGSSLPSGLSLSSAGLLSGTISATAIDTTYTFDIDVTDSENQSTTRQFSVTYKVDVVTWSSPADGTSFSWTEGQANSTTLVAASAAGKSVSFSVQAGSLPSNVTIAGNLLSGTPNVVQSNTSVTVRALAADTARYADQTFYFTVLEGNLNRGLFAGGVLSNFSSSYNVIDYITITTLGNATDFGDLSVSRGLFAGMASTTRAVFGGGYTNSTTYRSTIDYITIATAGNAVNFGNLDSQLMGTTGCSSTTRGLISGGMLQGATRVNTIQYITIASTGNSTDFGDLLDGIHYATSCSSPTRGIIGGGRTNAPAYINVIQYVTISSVGNSIDFGDLTRVYGDSGACSNSTRGLFGGGRGENIIDYITIASLGNATDFGDLNFTPQGNSACASPLRGIFAGGEAPSNSNYISYVTIATTGNAEDFGDLTQANRSMAGTSSNHGGLQ